jgi:hypothetical protein
MARAYQLIFEFEGDDLECFDHVIGLEDLLRDALASDEVDGHDAGLGIVNIFVFTDQPERCFEEAMRVIDGAEPSLSAAAYRAVKEEDYVRLWPRDDPAPFRLR